MVFLSEPNHDEGIYRIGKTLKSTFFLAWVQSYPQTIPIFVDIFEKSVGMSVDNEFTSRRAKMAVILKSVDLGVTKFMPSNLKDNA